MDYDRDMDSGIKEFISRSRGLLPDSSTEMSLADQRLQYEQLCAGFKVDRPTDVIAEDIQVNGVSIRHYRRQDVAVTEATLLYIHGGGFVVGSLETHDDICAELTEITGFETIAVDYRLAPEHKHPAALEDCIAVLEWLAAEQDSPIIIVGDSAGGWLGSMTTASRPYMVSGQVLIYPMLGASRQSPSYIEHANAPLLTADQVFWYWGQYFDCPVDPDQVLPPMNQPDHDNLPATVIIAAECDPLCSDGVEYAQKLKASGSRVESFVERGLPHGFLRSRHNTRKGKQAWRRITSACLNLGHGQWPYN